MKKGNQEDRFLCMKRESKYAVSIPEALQNLL